ncbi:MAG TPA: hypothetical protein VNR00_07370 [Opitutus sp.]|nr:hypothetical protein [Opitutus sp.]
MIITPGLLVYLFLCYVIAFFARNRKFGFWIYFILSFIFTPLIGFIIALASDRRVPIAAPASTPETPAGA